MDRFLLLIRERGRDDILDFHPDRPAACKTLIAYVRRKGEHSSQPRPVNDDVAIKRYFTGRGATYAIARVEPALPGPVR